VIPDFNRDINEGQLRPEERKRLYDLCIAEKPDVVFEVGTWKGGGSTYIISCALDENKKGILYTIEYNPEFYNHAVALYETGGALQLLRSRLFFHLGDSLVVIPQIIRRLESETFGVNILLLDGGTGVPTLHEFESVRPYMPVGAHLLVHDWPTDKAEVLRGLLPKDPDWQLEGITGELAVFKRIGNKYK
jgi:hypothetical protein